MIKKTQFAMFAAMVLSCSVSYGQVFTTISPSSLGFSNDATGINQTFDIGTRFGQSASAVQLLVTNGNVLSAPDVWAVSQGVSTSFQINSSVPLDGVIQHGPVLGSQEAQSGTGVSDGFTAALGEDWTLVSALDADYNASISTVDNINSYSVTYVGDSTEVEQNSSAFRWVSNQPITRFTVFSNNTAADEIVNNFSIGFRGPAVVPEPSAAVVIAFASTLCLMRRRRS